MAETILAIKPPLILSYYLKLAPSIIVMWLYEDGTSTSIIMLTASLKAEHDFVAYNWYDKQNRVSQKDDKYCNILNGIDKLTT